MNANTDPAELMACWKEHLMAADADVVETGITAPVVITYDSGALIVLPSGDVLATSMGQVWALKREVSGWIASPIRLVTEQT